jgi:cbb3-type cytochrome oxidase subunit 3
MNRTDIATMLLVLLPFAVAGVIILYQRRKRQERRQSLRVDLFSRGRPEE